MKTQPTWEEEFDKRFDLDDYGESHITQEKVKRFIAGLLTSHEAAAYKLGVKDVRQEIGERVKELQEANTENNMLTLGERFAVNRELEDVLAIINQTP